VSQTDIIAPLKGRTIIEFVPAGGSEVTRWAVALAGRIAGDFGASVIKVEPPGGDALRRTGPFVQGSDGRPESAAFAFLNGGKRSLALAGGEKDGVLLSTLAGKAIAVLTDDREALTTHLSAVPAKVMVEHGVPASLGVPDTRVADTTILALSGLLDLIGHPDAAPVPLGGHQASYVAGLSAFSGLMGALSMIDQGAESETVTISALEANIWSNWKSFAERLYMGRSPTREGVMAEWQTFPCTDGYAAFVYLDKDWPLVVRLIGDPRLEDPELNTRQGRRANAMLINDVVKPWYAARTRREVYEASKAAGLPMAPVFAVRELLDDPQYAAQRFLAPSGARHAPTHWLVPTVPTVWNGQRFIPGSCADGVDIAEAVL
jgi:crotonobetainyl-CoA:carnitine CoA-transferase CaiB-like acyl-CoA transferase